MMKLALSIALALMAASSDAVTIHPNIVKVSGKVGTSKSIAFKVFGHKTAVPVEIVQALDLKALDDKVLTKFVLGAEQTRIVPMNIVIKETKTYYLCAVLAASESMRLRTCAQIETKVIP